MQCFIYKSLKKEFLYLYVNKKGDFSKVPVDLFTSLGNLELVLELELTSDRKLAKESATNILDCLNNKGFFVQLPPLKSI